MKFVADACIDHKLVDRLRSDGHDVHSMAETAPQETDTDILQISVKLNAVVITDDKDFGDLVYRTCLPHVGIVLLRLYQVKPLLRIDYISEIINTHQQSLINSFTVIEPDSIRIRPATSA